MARLRARPGGAITLSAFSAGLAHELSNVVNGICLNAQLAQVWAARGDARVQDVAGEVLAQSDRCVMLVHSLRRQSQVPERLAPRPGNLSALLRFVATQAPAVLPHGVGLTVAPCPAVLRVQCDRAATRLVLLELARNAGQAGARSIAVEVELGARRATIRVTDDGAGVPPVIQQRLFQPFASGWRERGHLGLGLWQAHRILSAQNGALRCIESVPGETIFEASLRTLPAKADRRHAG